MTRGRRGFSRLLQAILGSLALLPSPVAWAALERSIDCASSRGRLEGEAEATCHAITHGGRLRTAGIYAGRPAPEAASLIFVLHGGGGSGSGMELLTMGLFNRIADRNGAIVVYPDGIDRHWNDGRELPETAARENVDDVGFLLALIEELASEQRIDRDRIFATGISNGGFMSLRLACDAATTFAAVAPVTAGFSDQLGSRCQPERPIAVAIFNGTEDPLVPWSGGPVKVLGASRGAVWSTMSTFERWLELDDCRERTTDARVDRVVEDGTALVVHHGGKCRDGIEVRLYEIQGGGHTWPLGVRYAWEWLVGRVSREVDATEEIWKFMSANARSKTREAP